MFLKFTHFFIKRHTAKSQTIIQLLINNCYKEWKDDKESYLYKQSKSIHYNRALYHGMVYSTSMNPGEDYPVKPSRVALGILGGGTSDQKILFSAHVFRPGPGCSKAGKRYPPDKSLSSG